MTVVKVVPAVASYQGKRRKAGRDLAELVEVGRGFFVPRGGVM